MRSGDENIRKEQRYCELLIICGNVESIIASEATYKGGAIKLGIKIQT